MASQDKTDKSQKPSVVDGFFNWLDAQIDALQKLREAFLNARALGAFGQPTDQVDLSSVMGAMLVNNGPRDVPVELPTGAFLNMSIPEAIKLYLSAVKRKQTVREIAVALKEGGMETTAANWENTLTGALHRLKANGAVLRFKDGWGLAEFYPESLRARIAKEDKPRKPAKRAKKTAAKEPRRAITLGQSSLSSHTEKAS